MSSFLDLWDSSSCGAAFGSYGKRVGILVVAGTGAEGYSLNEYLVSRLFCGYGLIIVLILRLGKDLGSKLGTLVAAVITFFCS